MQSAQARNKSETCILHLYRGWGSQGDSPSIKACCRGGTRGTGAGALHSRVPLASTCGNKPLLCDLGLAPLFSFPAGNDEEHKEEEEEEEEEERSLIIA